MVMPFWNVLLHETALDGHHRDAPHPRCQGPASPRTAGGRSRGRRSIEE